MGPGGSAIEALCGSSLFFAVLLGWMAKNRRLSIPGWVLLGVVPVLNVVGFVILLLVRPKGGDASLPTEK